MNTPLTEKDEELSKHLSVLANLLKRTDNAWRYASMQEFVLANGVFFPLRFAPVEKGPAKHCYMNAWRAAAADEKLVYCEGYAMIANVPLPFDHAWCVDGEGRIVEPTWDTPGVSYLGICFEMAFVAERIFAQGVYGLLCDKSAVRLFLENGAPPEALRTPPGENT